MKILRNLILLGLAAFFVVVGVAFFSLNALIKKGMENAGPLVAKVETRLGSANIMPFTGSGKLSQIFVGNPAGFKTPYALKVDKVQVRVALPSIKTNTIVVDAIQIQAPDVFIEGGLTDKNNLTAIQHNLEAFASSQPKAREGAPKAAEPGKKVVVKDLLITGAKVHWISPLTLGQEVLLTLPDIHLQNIGQEKQGVTWSELFKLVTNELFKASNAGTGKNLGKAVDQIKEKGLENINKAADSFKGLLH